MGKIVVSENVTLDGVIQDPAGDEGFRAGGSVGLIGNSPQLAKLALDEALAAGPPARFAGTLADQGKRFLLRVSGLSWPYPYRGGRLQFQCMGVQSRVAAVGPGGATTLLGRDAEMAALRGVLDRAGSGPPAAAVIRGEAGIVEDGAARHGGRGRGR